MRIIYPRHSNTNLLSSFRYYFNLEEKLKAIRFTIEWTLLTLFSDDRPFSSQRLFVVTTEVITPGAYPKLKETINLPNVNVANPMHMAMAARKSNGPWLFFWIKMLPIRTGTSLQHLNITCVG